jgi:uncharacterized membrane protein (DUF373 family)
MEGLAPEAPEKGLRGAVARAFSIVEDVVYVGMGILLAYSAGALLLSGGIALWKATLTGAPLEGVVALLDRTLLVLMLVELLYTVHVSFQHHALVPEPFLIVGLIAATRRILVVTAEFSLQAKNDPVLMRQGMMEIGLLTLMVLALVASLLLLRRREVTKPAR